MASGNGKHPRKPKFNTKFVIANFLIRNNFLNTLISNNLFRDIGCFCLNQISASRIYYIPTYLPTYIRIAEVQQ